MQYYKAWHTARIEAKQVYTKTDEYYKIAQQNYDPDNDVMNWLIEELYLGIREGTNIDWNEKWEELKEKKESRPGPI